MKSKKEEIVATLVRGETYILAGRNGAPDQVFTKGQAVAIDSATHDWLRTHAVDQVTVLADNYDDDDNPAGFERNGQRYVGKDVQKFRFSELAAAAS